MHVWEILFIGHLEAGANGEDESQVLIFGVSQSLIGGGFPDVFISSRGGGFAIFSIGNAFVSKTLVAANTSLFKVVPGVEVTILTDDISPVVAANNSKPVWIEGSIHEHHTFNVD